MTLVNRWYQILQLLYFNHEVTIDKLRDQLNVTNQTIKKSIELLNNEINPIAEIVQKEKLFTLEIFDYDSFQEIMGGKLRQTSDYNSASRRFAYILKRLVEEKNYVLIDDLAEEIGVSRGTLSNDLKNGKSILKKYRVEIVGTPNKGIYLYGQEENLRLIYLYQVVPYFPKMNLKEKVEQIIKKMVREYNLDFSTFGLLASVIEIMIVRVKNGYQLTNFPPNYISKVKDTELFEELVVEIESEYKISLSKYDQMFVTFPILLNHNLALRQDDDDSLKKILRRMLLAINQNIHFEVDEQSFFMEIRNHLRNLLIRLYYYVESNDLFNEQIEGKYPLAYELSKLSIFEIAHLMDRPVSNVEINYLTFYFELFLQKNRSKYSKKIAIVCNTGIGTSSMIKFQIERVIGDDIEIVQYSEEKYMDVNFDEYFAVFTTIPLKNVSSSIPIIRITNLFNDNWLRSAWDKATKIRKSPLKYTELMFHSYHSTGNYKKDLINITQELVLNGNVDSYFSNRLIERENKGSTVFEQKIAFPHAINLASQQIFLMIAKPDNNMNHLSENNEVDLIVLLAIPSDLTKNSEEELMQIYEQIFATTSNMEQLYKLKLAKNLDDIMEIFGWKG